MKSMSDFHPLSPEHLEELLPLAASWAEEEEKRILADGVALTEEQLADATRVGVTQPQRVRLLMVSAIPMPEDPLLRAAGEATGLLSPFTAGLTLRYGIFVRCDFIEDRRLIAHELVHTGQYERFGSVAAFLRQYLTECVTMGYPAAPLEQEAIMRSEALFT